MDLANEIIRKTYHKSYAKEIGPINMTSAEFTRRKITNARRFVLSASMSEYVADLASVPFLSVARERREDVLASLRHTAKLPFPSMFVQLDGWAFRQGLVKNAESKKDFWGHQVVPPNEDVLRTVGWYLEHEPNNPNVIWISEWFEWEGSVSTLPFFWTYRTDDTAWPDKDEAAFGVDTRAGMFAHGITGLHDRTIGIVYPKPLASYPKEQVVRVVNESKPEESFDVHALVPEFGGVIRYVLGFLASLNDTPKSEEVVTPEKKYFSGGAFHKPLPHTVMTLKLGPRQTSYQLAKRVIAAIRKGHHEVRPHWRVYGLKEGDAACAREDHIWSDEDLMGHAHCKNCKAKRVWVTLPNGRGDIANPVPQKSRYYVTHDK